MLTILVVSLILLGVLVGININTMASITTLAPALRSLQDKLNRIFLEVQALKDAYLQAGEIPAEASALLANLDGNLVALESTLPDVPSAPSQLP